MQNSISGWNVGFNHLNAIHIEYTLEQEPELLMKSNISVDIQIPYTRTSRFSYIRKLLRKTLQNELWTLQPYQKTASEWSRDFAATSGNCSRMNLGLCSHIKKPLEIKDKSVPVPKLGFQWPVGPVIIDQLAIMTRLQRSCRSSYYEDHCIIFSLNYIVKLMPILLGLTCKCNYMCILFILQASFTTKNFSTKLILSMAKQRLRRWFMNLSNFSRLVPGKHLYIYGLTWLQGNLTLAVNHVNVQPVTKLRDLKPT